MYWGAPVIQRLYSMSRYLAMHGNDDVPGPPYYPWECLSESAERGNGDVRCRVQCSPTEQPGLVPFGLTSSCYRVEQLH